MIAPKRCDGCGCILDDENDIFCEECAEDEDGDDEFEEDENEE